MKFQMKTLDDFQVAGKTVLLRVDINEPVNWETGELSDVVRIEACVPTIRELSDSGAKVVLLAHQGSDIEFQNFYTTKPHANVLAALLEREVLFLEDVCGPAAVEQIRSLQPGDILLLDNVRLLAEEQTLFELHLKLSHQQQANTWLVRTLAPLADYYVCDAFAAAHRDQPSLCGFQQRLPSAMGRLFEQEYSVISQLMEQPKRPSVFVLGGAKVSDAFLMMNRVLEQGAADQVLSGGLVAQILLWAAGVDIGSSSKEFIVKKGYDSLLPQAQTLLSQYGDRIQLPVDVAACIDGKRQEYDVSSPLPTDALYTDIGAKTAAAYEKTICEAAMVFVNGPMGVFEQSHSEWGTKIVWEALANTNAYTVIGGGDSITACNQYQVEKQVDYICTGGGALIRFLSGEELPVVKALRHGATIDRPVEAASS